MKNILVAFLFVGLIASCVTTHTSAQETKGKDEKKIEGKSVFMENKCSNCHSIDVAGITKKSGSSKTGPPDLSMVGTKHDAAWMAKFVQKEESLNGKKHMIKFNGSVDELKVLTQWLGSLKGGEKKEKK